MMALIGSIPIFLANFNQFNMKTTEEKAKAYNEAIEKAREYWETDNDNTLDIKAKGTMEYLFPELADSKDEKMWKLIKKYAHCNISDMALNADHITREQLESWIEKQSYTDGIIEKAKTEKQRVIITETNGNANIDWDTRSLEDARNLLECGLQYINTELEKQDEQTINNIGCEGQKETNLVEILKHYPKETELYSPLYGRLWLAEVDEKNEIITCYKHHLEEGCTRAVLEQEDTVSFYSNGTTGLPDFNISKDCMLFLYDIEKQKVESKFKNGQWIVFNGLTLYVNEVVQGYYRTTSIGGIPNSYDWNIDNAARLWSIEDAKDGDVLVCPLPKEYEAGEQIFMFKEINSRDYLDNCIEYYCRICQGDFYKNEIGFMGTTDGIFHPATEEQRDLLFQKMKEAGYTFDFEKKELKKIDNEEVNGEDYGIDGLWHAQRILEKTLSEVDGYQSDDGILDHKAAITAVKKLYEKKPTESIKFDNEFENQVSNLLVSVLNGEHEYNEGFVKYVAQSLLSYAKNELKPTEWSHEDDVMVHDILGCLPVKTRPEYNQRRANWIKSLKNRVQPKQEWSEEDEMNLNQAIYVCHQNGYDGVENWLKSVKDRVQPQNNIVTDKELAQAKKEAYNETLDKIEYHDDWPTFDDGWNAAIWYLKKRNGIPQNRWKPTDGQMEALKEACDKSWEPDGLDPLYTLYEDLKKLKGE